MNIDIFSFLSFVIITSFTPGPNNITSASMGILYGYKKTLRYLLGIVCGFFMVMMICSLISSTLFNLIPSFEVIIHIVGAIYILWLAYHTLRASYSIEESDQHLFGFTKGFLLQLLNPKGIVYGLTIYATFLSSIVGRPLYLFLSALFLAFIAFCSVSTWTLFGTSIRTYMNRPKVKKAINTVLALLLVYTAVEISGVLELFL